jgi:pimeloyl-ACP methyl ester carboxylesterase
MQNVHKFYIFCIFVKISPDAKGTDESAGGEPVSSHVGSTYVLIPGAGGESWYWHLVAAELRARGHEVVAPDLPAADDGAHLEDYAKVVMDAIGERSNLIVVAQSLGAFTAPLLCERADVRQFVLVAPMIPARGESPGEWGSEFGLTDARRAQDEREGRDPDAEFDVLTAFFHDVPFYVIAEAFRRGEPRQSDTPFGDPWPLAAWPDVPTRVIAAARDRLFPLDFMRRIARERLGCEVEVIDSGHLPALSRPKELVGLLEA